MGANPTIYCLENITDYFEFERLCSDLMALEGYSSLEPLGGFKDKGRDAVHVNNAEETTIFAYSVREDWRAKLAEDASKIRKYGHTCDRIVFMTTAEISAGERDEAVASIQNDYGWLLQIYGMERLRILLDVNHPQIKELHPQIFPPYFLAPIEAPTPDTRTHLYISFSPEDTALADWLARKLAAEGYWVWHERFKLLGGENYPDDVDEAIQHNAFRVIALYSQASLQNPEVMRQRMTALNLGRSRQVDFLIPLNLDGVTPDQLDRHTRELVFIPFANWASGLQQLLTKLSTTDCPKTFYDGKRVAASIFLEQDVLSDEAETVLSNCLQVEELPTTILLFKEEQDVPHEQRKEISLQWAHRRAGGLTLSFHRPPEPIANEYNIHNVGEAPWPIMEAVEGVTSGNLVAELLRKSILVKCHQKGLQYCPTTKLHYFPEGLVKGNRLLFTRPDGLKTYVNATGQRKFSRSAEYKYYLAPVFWISQNLMEDFTVLIRIRVRFTDTNGQVLSARSALSRRKHLCRHWWNQEWLNRLLAVCQYLSEDGRIVIGELPREQILLNASPLRLNAPISIDESVLDRLSYERSELIELLNPDSDDRNGEGAEDD